MAGSRILLAAVLIGTPVVAAAQPAAQRPAQFEALTRCRTVGNDAARLDCFDRAVAAMQAAEGRGEILLVDRHQVRQTRRRLFGLPLPEFSLFGSRENPADQPRLVEGVIAAATLDRNRDWLVRLQDGAEWLQRDDHVLALEPRPGQRVIVTRNAIGTFMMRVNGQPGIRVKRVR